ncbi:MAG TPA: penicillin-binding protein 2, partial [Candidatus Limnocylindrales bacterium]
MPGRTDSRARLLLLLCFFVVGALALGARAAYWQVLDHDRLVADAADQTTVTIDTPSQRGDIFDRTGTVVLATTVQRERLVAAPDQLTPDQRRATVAELTRLLGLDDAAAIALRDKLASKSRYLVIQHGIDRQLGDRIQAAIDNHQVYGLALEQEPERVYPQPGGGPGTTLAAHLLGFVNRDGVGQYGVEQQYQATLGGSPRIVVAQRDPAGRPMLESADVTSAGAPGTDLRLTIDAGLQLSVEQELLAAWIADKAKRVSAVVMDPYTGEVYAMASYPSFDANDFKAIASTDPSRFINPLVASVYEPGSVFKMMTAAAALEAGTVTPSTRIKDTGTLKLDGGRTKIDDADRKGMGWMTFQDGVAYSRNVVAAKVALGLGDTTRESSAALYDTWRQLGYGAPTGIDVAGEVQGIVRDPAITPWREIDLANGAFGQ